MVRTDQIHAAERIGGTQNKNRVGTISGIAGAFMHTGPGLLLQIGRRATMPTIDNFDNNQQGTELELSDLYGCRVPMSVKILNGIPKSMRVDFASLEHAWCMRRMICIPLIGGKRDIVTVSHMHTVFVTTQADAACFLAQFEATGVFGSWEKTNVYYPVHKITREKRGAHNIGLIARFVCSNNPKAKSIREQIRGVAADRWKNSADTVARSIACCLWMRRTANCTSYKSGLRMLACSKYKHNPAVSNVLVLTRGLNLYTTYAACCMVTATRRQTADAYMHSLSTLSATLCWQMNPETLLALFMAFHSRLGRHSQIGHLTMDVFLAIVGPLLDAKHQKKYKQFRV